MKTLTTLNWTQYAGQLFWLVFKIDALGTTASQIRSIIGPSPYMPSWVAAGGQVTPIAWKLTGQASGALPSIFPTGGAVSSSAPAVAIQYNVQ